MNRRHFLSTMGGLPLIGSLNGVAWAATEPTANVALATPYNKLLILIELKGANDGLNTVINGVLENQYARALDGLKRDPKWRGERDALRWCEWECFGCSDRCC